METITGTPEADLLLASMGDTLLGAEGDDTLDATAGSGGNQLFGQQDDDLLLAGSNDILVGGAGDDRLFVGSGGAVLIGGAGVDQLWIVNDGQLPPEGQLQTVIDYTDGTDVLGLIGLTQEQLFGLTVVQMGADTILQIDGQDVALLRNTIAGNLTAEDFAVIDPEPEPEISISIEPESIIEGESTTITLSLSEPAPEGGLAVTWIEEDSDGALGDIEFLLEESTNIVDFEGLADGDVPTGAIVTIAEGATEATVVFEAVADDLEEGEETTTYTLQPGTGYTVDAANDTVVLTIADPDPLPVAEVSISIAPESIIEGESTTISLTLSEPAPEGGLAVTWSEEDSDSALGDLDFLEDESTNVIDFEGLADGDVPTGAIVTIAEGATEATVVFEAVADDVEEGEETTTYTLEPGTGYTVDAANDTAVLTISEPAAAGVVANDDELGADVDTPLVISVDELLANDESGDGTALEIVEVANATNGTVELDAEAGEITFTPDAGFAGAASFEYTAGDVEGTTDTATVIVSVTSPSNVPPIMGRFELEDIQAVNGFIITGNDELSASRSGRQVSDAGDINNDGLADILVGEVGAFGQEAFHVVFGDGNFPLELNVTDLNGSNGFTLSGVAIGESADSAGDFNGDGIDDFVVGAPTADAENSGQTYVIFGGQDFDADLNLSTFGDRGVRFDGIDFADQSGSTVAGGGDYNDDGFSDIIIGAPNANQIYVVLGSSSFSSPVFDLSDLLEENGGDGSAGFYVEGINVNDELGFAVADIGDINNDGIDDLAFSSPETGEFGAQTPGQTYVVFGSESFAANFDLTSLDGNNGFVFNGELVDDETGFDISGAGDVNGDGIDDLLVSAIGVEDADSERIGAAYVIFGAPDVGDAGSIGVSDLDGSNGFVINGSGGGNFDSDIGFSISSAGDFNQDGFDDILIGAPEYDIPVEQQDEGEFGLTTGATYLVFGRGDFDATLELASIDVGTDDGILFQGSGFSAGPPPAIGSGQAGFSVDFLGDVNFDGIDDIIIGAPNGIPLSTSYVFYGFEGSLL